MNLLKQGTSDSQVFNGVPIPMGKQVAEGVSDGASPERQPSGKRA